MAQYTYHGPEGTNPVTGTLFDGRVFDEDNCEAATLALMAQWKEKKWLKPVAVAAKHPVKEVE